MRGSELIVVMLLGAACSDVALSLEPPIGADAGADAGAEPSSSDGGLVVDAGVLDGGAMGSPDAQEASDAVTPDAAELADALQAPPDAAAIADVGTLDAGSAPVSPAAMCPVDSMELLYPGRLPPNPFGQLPAASACVAAEHDVIILLGCPSNDDGSPSTCQTRRVELGIAIMQTGYGHRFIVTGAAVHNAHVEADALAGLLMAEGIPAADIRREARAEHTDENIYYSTRIMEAEGWASALVVSENPGHLVMTAICDSNCCVDLGRLTVVELPLVPDSSGRERTPKVGHYVRYPWADAVTPAECAQIELPLKAMCTNRAARRACAADFRL